MNGLIAFLSSKQDLSYLLLRVCGGGILFWAGYQKLIGPGFAGMGKIFAKIGIILPQVTGPFIMLLEFCGGAMLVLGLLTRYVGVLFTIQFIVAFLAVNMGAGYKGFRLDLLLIVFSLLMATHGGGPYSLDRTLRRQ